MASRPLLRVPVPPGRVGVELLLPALRAALDGTGPAIAPVPTVSATVSADYVSTILAALRPDDPLDTDEAAIVLSTSGSTGAPRGVLLSAAQATAFNEIANGGGSPAWVAALPVTSMGGCNVLVRALASGRAPVVVPSIGGAGPFTPNDFAVAVADAARDGSEVRTSLVPAQLARLLDDEAGIAALQACSSVLVGGAATRPGLRQLAAERGIAVTTTYGATETAGGCIYGGMPLPDVAVATDGDPGRVSITSPSTALGYRLDPRASAEAFDGRTFHTQDLGHVDDAGMLTLLGRIDDVVVIGGVNVSPLAVEHIAGEGAGVRECAAVAVDVHTDRGPELHLFVVGDADGEALRTSIVERLGMAARPTVHGVAALPHLPNGKVDRRALQERAAARRD
jgi:O-succinylbenzoic acid--CoA ligase